MKANVNVKFFVIINNNNKAMIIYHNIISLKWIPRTDRFVCVNFNFQEILRITANVSFSIKTANLLSKFDFICSFSQKMEFNTFVLVKVDIPNVWKNDRIEKMPFELHDVYQGDVCKRFYLCLLLNFNLTRYRIFTRDSSDTTNSLNRMPVSSFRRTSLPFGIFSPSGRMDNGCG